MPDDRHFPEKLNDRLMWMTRGANCTVCNALRGRVYTYDAWMSANVWPGFHVNCDCYLKKVGADARLSDPDFFGTDLPLTLHSWNANLPFLGSLLQLDFNYQPLAMRSINDIQKYHLLYGADLPIGEVLKRMKNEYEGFFKKSSIWDAFFQWRVLKTIQHFECIGGEYCGTQPPGLKFLLNPDGWKDLVMPCTVSGSTFSRRRNIFIHSTLNNQLKPDELLPYTPSQSYHWGG